MVFCDIDAQRIAPRAAAEARPRRVKSASPRKTLFALRHHNGRGAQPDWFLARLENLLNGR
jgi:hypothetical protein